MLDTFKKFMQDPDGWEMFVTGPAGTGKTTKLAELVSHCIANDIPYVVCAYTHKACGILRDKLPEGANIQTLHSFLTKRPTVNEQAKHIQHLESAKKHGISEEYDVMFLDEYSQVGEKDYADIGLLQDPGYEGEVALRVVYIGDSNQLPPIGDQAGIYPGGNYQVKLTHIYRQAGDNPLLGTLGALVTMIEGGNAPGGLPEHATFIRGVDLAKVYDAKADHMLLAYTNKRVEELNRLIAGKSEPGINEALFSPTTKQPYTFIGIAEKVFEISRAFGNEPLMRGSKFRTLEHLLTMDCCEFYNVQNEDGEEETFAVIFGHYQYKLKLEQYSQAAVQANNAIGDNAKQWAAVNKTHKLARARAKAWRDYFTFKECVVCMDFPFAMTVHKSQGSTYDTVLVDTNDLYICAAKNYQLYLKLMYVAISRASNKVYTS